jgi:methyl-accepting chemotaxis protein
MRQKRTNRRKVLNFSVNRGLQLRMIGKMSCIILASLLISSGVYYYFANQTISESFLLCHIQARNFLDFLLPIVGISFVISLLVGTIASLFLPKNLAGPLYRIEQEVRRLTNGDLTVQICLRSGDEARSLAGQINQMVELYRETLVSVQDSLQEIQKICDAGTQISTEECQAIHDRIVTKISKFKVSK